jgi:tetratricopeptide (TPR) repeat protein
LSLETAHTAHNIAMAFRRTGSLIVSERFLSPLAHSVLLLIQKNLGNADAAAPWYDRSLRSYLATVGEKHAFVGSTYLSLGLMALGKKDYVEAEKQLEKSLAVLLEAVGEKNNMTGSALYNLGLLHFDQCK